MVNWKRRYKRRNYQNAVLNHILMIDIEVLIVIKNLLYTRKCSL